jgi:uncharacterized membrane protein
MGHDVRQRVRYPRWAVLLACCCAMVLFPLSSCASDDDDEEGHEHEAGDHDDMPVGDPSGATCPTDSTGLTYDAFGKKFMTDYCVRCHSDQLKTMEARMGAPIGHDFNVEPGIRTVWQHIDQKAASGDLHTNTAMPPPADSGAKPTLEERKKLGQWLVCAYGDEDET